MINTNLKLGNSIIGFLLLMLPYALPSCRHANNSEKSGALKLFTQLPASSTGVYFSNNLTYNDRLNPYSYRSFYNGAGVAAGDINNDGLPDLFFCSNQGPDKLYLNKGNFQFEDITAKAGIVTDGLWSTGVTFADVNGDGLLDIYVCRQADFKVGWRGNQLYINQGDNTFREMASEYGLAANDFSIQAVFFDYDRDGDLDCYLLNNSGSAVGKFDLVRDQRKIPALSGGNKLFRNDGNHFTDVTASAGIYSSSIGFGLGVSISDINKDGWPDIFVSNDFFERDYLYINNQHGGFKEDLENYMREISLNSMGADIADINNDGYPDIFVTDMLPRDEGRIKSKTKFEDWEKYQANLAAGYYHQFTRNTLQLNRGPLAPERIPGQEATFSEIGRFAGVDATDWSWGALIADLDNDGKKDIFVSNGIYKDVTDQDILQYLDTNTRHKSVKQLIDMLPSSPIQKFAFANNGDNTFTDRAEAWGINQVGFSNGSVYADLDNDGDLDLVTNNVNMTASIYRNNAEKLYPQRHFLHVKFNGLAKNRFGIGSKITIHAKDKIIYQENLPERGFESCIESRQHVGLGEIARIDSIEVQWPDGLEQTIRNIAVDQEIVLNQSEAHIPTRKNKQPGKPPVFGNPQHGLGLDWLHRENVYNDFNRDRLLFHMLSTSGPRMCKGDVNGDGLDDIYICGAKNQPGALFIQMAGGKFRKAQDEAMARDSACEDVDCLFFDADNDGDQDLIICSGGNEYPHRPEDLASRLYLNDGQGHFSKASGNLPLFAADESSSCVCAEDVDGDGDLDLFIGVRLREGHYGQVCRSYLLINDGHGHFADSTRTLAPELMKTGMVTDAKWVDYDLDGKPDLILAGEYMPITSFHNDGGRLSLSTLETGLTNTNGWWNRISIADINGDGYPDIIAGNHGLNSRFKASISKPVSMYSADFEGNGIIEQIICTFNGENQYPMVLRHDLVAVLPFLKKQILTYASYKNKKIDEIFSSAQLADANLCQAYCMESSVFINNTHGQFSRSPLPAEVQFSPVYAIAVGDFNKDGKPDLLVGGNFYQAKPECGIYDASYGLLLTGDGAGHFEQVPIRKSNFYVKGAVREILPVRLARSSLVLVARNNDSLEVIPY
jgi:hypothetical protein